MRCPNGYMFTEGRNCRRCQTGGYHNAVLHQCFEERSQAAAYAGILWTHRFVMKLEQKVSMFVGVSEFVRGELIAWGLPASRIAVVRNFTDHDYHNADETPGSFGLFIGRLSDEKGVAVLLESLKRAGDPPFKIVGDGPARPALLAQAAGLGLENTKWLGRVDPAAVPRLVRESRFIAIPSLWRETSCLAGIEGMAGGRPLLVTDLGALPELVEGGAGLKCRPGDPTDMSAKMVRLMTDDDLCRKAGGRGLHLVRSEFGPEIHLRRLESVYEKVLRRPAEGSRS